MIPSAATTRKTSPAFLFAFRAAHTSSKLFVFPSLVKTHITGVGLPVSSTLLQNPYVLRVLWEKLDYQSVRHCSKTRRVAPSTRPALDYQSVRHCSKTLAPGFAVSWSWITSQFDTAPKPSNIMVGSASRWITSQFDTAPKPSLPSRRRRAGWITSQFDTAPKRTRRETSARRSWITSQFDTAPKHSR